MEDPGMHCHSEGLAGRTSNGKEREAQGTRDDLIFKDFQYRILRNSRKAETGTPALPSMPLLTEVTSGCEGSWNSRSL